MTIDLALFLCFTKDLFCDYISGFLSAFNCLSLSDIVTVMIFIDLRKLLAMNNQLADKRELGLAVV